MIHLGQGVVVFERDFIQVSQVNTQSDLSYDTYVIQHTIPLRENKKPFKQKLRRANLVLLPLIEKEVKRMYEAGLIAPIRFSEWISNLVPTGKKMERDKTVC